MRDGLHLTKRAVAFLLCGLLLCPAAQAESAGYTNVPCGAWYAEAAEYCKTVGLMSGTGDNRFTPGRGGVPDLATSGAVPSDRFSACLCRAFTDVSVGAWYADAIIWASYDGCIPVQ